MEFGNANSIFHSKSNCVESKAAYNLAYPGVADFSKTKYTQDIASFKCS